jgi:peptidoglycan/xylan/chitin deacetylase (PgdA/CDA1 family)
MWYLAGATLLLLLLVVVYIQPQFIIRFLANRDPVVFNIRTKSKVVALTIDDGPTTSTPKILKVLKKYGAQATFFVIGSQIPNNEEIINRY